MKVRREAYEQEMKTPLAAGLSPAEIEELEELGKEADTRKKALLEAGKRKNEVSTYPSLLVLKMS
jgi:hypothetical protein